MTTIVLTPDQELILQTIEGLASQNKSMLAARKDLVSVLTTKEWSKKEKAPMTKTHLERNLLFLTEHDFVDWRNTNYVSKGTRATPKELQEIHNH